MKRTLDQISRVESVDFTTHESNVPNPQDVSAKSPVDCTTQVSNVLSLQYLPNLDQISGGVESPVNLTPQIPKDVPNLQPVPNVNLQPVPNLSDTDKLMFLAHREEMIKVQDWEHRHEYYYKNHVHRTMNPSDGSLTMTNTYQEEYVRSEAIERLLKRKRLDEAFNGAIGSSMTPHYFVFSFRVSVI